MFFRLPAHRRSAPRTRRLPQHLEHLEERRLLAITSFFDASDGSLTVVSDADDSIVVRPYQGAVLINNGVPQSGPLAAASVLAIHVTGGPGTLLIDLSDVHTDDFLALVGTTIDFAQPGDAFALQALGGNGGGADGPLTPPLEFQGFAPDAENIAWGPAPLETFASFPTLPPLEPDLTRVDPKIVERVAEIWLGTDWRDQLGLEADAELEADDWQALLGSEEFVSAIDPQRTDALARQLLGNDWQTRLDVADVETFVTSGQWKSLLTRQGKATNFDAETAAAIDLSARQLLSPGGLVELGEAWPRSIPFTTLFAAASSRIQSSPVVVDTSQVTRDTQQLAEPLLRCYATSLVTLSVQPSPFTLEATQTPRAARLARLQAATSNSVTTLQHDTVRLNDLERHVLPCLDGQHDRAAVAKALANQVTLGKLQVHEQGMPVTNPSRVEEILGSSLDACLQGLARTGLLEG